MDRQPYEQDDFERQPADSDAATGSGWPTIPTPDPHAVRQATPDPLIREAPSGEPANPENNIVRLPDGTLVETPPASLAGAKDTLAARRAAERRLESGEEGVEPVDDDLSNDLGDQSL